MYDKNLVELIMFTIIQRRNNWQSINVGNITFIGTRAWDLRVRARMQTLPLETPEARIAHRLMRKHLIYNQQDRSFDR